VMRPSYGLAEASLLVTTPQTENRPLFGQFDREALAQGQAKLVDKGPDAVSIASCGQVVRPQFLVIVDPETKQELPDGHVGE
ncbi:AMP-binding protein, partial [Bacteroides thetaiotaomicron]|nr:AMP-binding protein [Bacteroides thetaiotaomicron]